MSRLSRSSLSLAAIAALLIIPIAAVAQAGDEETPPAEKTTDGTRLSFWFDDGVLIFGPTDADSPLDCTPETELTIEDGIVAGDVADGCQVLVIEGTINHGQVVSQTVAALKDLGDELDAPFGHYVREIARSDAGKGHTDDSVEIENDDDGGGPPDHAVARGHDKRNDSAEDSPGTGPPPHARGHNK